MKKKSVFAISFVGLYKSYQKIEEEQGEKEFKCCNFIFRFFFLSNILCLVNHRNLFGKNKYISYSEINHFTTINTADT